MAHAKLNLTRKLRSKTFDQIVGQTLCVRMLKNSLYLGHYFPVYLFSGQRGCGKTTMARVFATALNCVKLEQFQKNPKTQSLPCMTCDSCIAMADGIHPDFIEMDAASHTGVESVRQVIDAASLLPVMGSKKIYLIDEAHMLSRAAFNALLKVLEEPPANVVFILATTDVHKIIDTVKSRCFQLLFKAVDPTELVPYLQTVCIAENIPYDKEGLTLVTQETRGSVRDALNIIEQVRFSAGSVTGRSVLQVLDHVDDYSIVHIIKLILEHNPRDMLVFLKEINIHRYSAEYIWRRFTELMRSLVWIKYGVKPHDQQDHDQLEMLVSSCPAMRLHAILRAVYDNEDMFLKTAAQHLFLEMFFVLLCQQNEDGTNTEGSCIPASTRIQEQVGQEHAGEEEEHDGDGFLSTNMSLTEDALENKWRSFVETEQIKNESLVHTLLSQGVCMKVEKDSVIVHFGKDLVFFESIIHDARALWHPHFTRVFAPAVHLVMHFVAEPRQALASAAHISSETTEVSRTNTIALDDAITGNNKDLSDMPAWKTTQMVLHHFPGSVYEVRS